MVCALAFFVSIARHSEHRKRMGWQLPVASLSAALALLLGVSQPLLALLALVGWAR